MTEFYSKMQQPDIQKLHIIAGWQVLVSECVALKWLSRTMNKAEFLLLTEKKTHCQIFSLNYKFCLKNWKIAWQFFQFKKKNRSFCLLDSSIASNIEQKASFFLKISCKIRKFIIFYHFKSNLEIETCFFVHCKDCVFVLYGFFLGIEISDEEAEKIFTVQQAADLIKTKIDQL